MQLLDLAAGNFSEVLLEDPGRSCLVLFEARRYSRLARLLAVEAHHVRVPTTLIADPYCDWGWGVVDEMFVVQTEMNQFWDSTAPMASLASLLINGVFNELGPAVEKRMNEVSAYYSRFIGYVGDPNDPIE